MDTAAGKPITTPKGPTAFVLNFFSSIPDTIDGCGSFFTYDTLETANDRYIFLSNLDEFAMIRVNGQFVYLNRNIAESRELDPGSSYVEVFEGSGYKTILTVQKTKSYGEGGFYKGTLEVIRGKERITLRVHGEMGC